MTQLCTPSGQGGDTICCACLQGKEVIFMETAKRLQDSRSHAFVECIPVPPKVAAKAPLYLKKSIDDAEDEWSQHHAKRWIDTAAKVIKTHL